MVGHHMSNFVDESGLHVKGGDGGAGAVSFRREAHTPKGGPDGGDGGKGGDVWLVADRNIPSLLGFKDHPFRRADNGVHGTSKKAHGRNGRDILVLQANHPSPLSARRPPVPFLGCGHFAQAREWLAARGVQGVM